MTGYSRVFTANTSTGGRDWRERAVCRDEDPELFFPLSSTGPGAVQTEEAKWVCRRCPVVSDCLSWALDTGQDFGVWGGMSEDERRQLRRRPAAVPDHQSATAITEVRISVAVDTARLRSLAESGYTDREIASVLSRETGEEWDRVRVGEMRRTAGIRPGWARRAA